MTEPDPSAARFDASPGAVLFRFVRHWSRRQHPAASPAAEHGRDVWVVEAVHTPAGRGEVTVNDVAAEVGIDQSAASRMLTHAAEQKYLSIAPSEADARRRTVEITAAGLGLLAVAHDWQEQVFGQLTAGWTLGERAEFHRAMTRLIERSSSELAIW